MFSENIINLTFCSIIKMPAFRVDKFSAGRTKCKFSGASNIDDDIYHLIFKSLFVISSKVCKKSIKGSIRKSEE